MLYLKSPLSKAIRDRSAAISGGEVIPYWLIAVMRWGAASTFVAHSPAAGALSQDPEVGAITRSIEAAEVPACRAERGKNEGAGMAEADAATARRRVDNFEKSIMHDYWGFGCGRQMQKGRPSRYGA